MTGRADARVVALVGLLTGVAAYWLVLAADASYIYDDFIYFRASHVHGLTAEWLDSVWFQHWAPLHRLTFWALQRWFPLQWAPALVSMLAFLLAGSVLLWLVLDELFGRRWLHVGLVGLFATSIMHVPGLQWASAGFQVLPAMACSLGALWAFLVYRRTLSWPWAVAAGIFTTVGLGFYVRPVLIPLWCALAWLAFQSADLRPRALARDVRRDVLAWICVLVPVAAYIVHYVVTDVAGETSAPTVHQLADYLGIAWLRGFTPSWVTGVQIPQSGARPTDSAAIVVGQVCVAAAVLWSLARDRGAWRAWLLWVVAFSATIGLVAAGRLQALGPTIGYDLRYLSDLAWLFPLTLAGALRTVRAPRALIAAAIGALALHAALAWNEARTMRHNWPSAGARHYLAQLRKGVRRAQALHPGRLHLVDGIVPESVIFGNSPPYNRYSSVVSLFDANVDFDGLQAPLFAPDADGRVTPVGFAAAADAPVSHALTTGRVVRRGAARCAGAGAGATYFEWRLPRPLHAAGGLAVRVAAAGPGTGRAPLFVDQGHGYPALTPVDVALARGRAPIVALDATRVVALRLDVPAGICVRRVTLGRLVRGQRL